jgi:hypothetical protein
MSHYPPPHYRNPKQAAEHRAYLIRTVLWLAAIPPLLFLLMVFGYSDQAPTVLRDFTAQLDAMLGRPVWSLIGPAPK